MTEKESTLRNLLLELLPSVDLADVFITELKCLCINIILDLIKKGSNHVSDTLLLVRSLLACVAACKLHCSVLKVTGTHCKTYRHTLEFPFSELEARTKSVTGVDLNADTLGLEFLLVTSLSRMLRSP